jgi:hypothetical protein
MKGIAAAFIERRIFRIRTKQVMLDRDLAELYGVPTKALNRAVKRHRKRFPKDFMMQLTPVEFRKWRCQFGTSNLRAGGGSEDGHPKAPRAPS